MAIPWLTVLQAVPWGKVIENAPKVADGAKKLWGSVGRKPTAPQVTPGNTHNTSEQARIAELEAAVVALQAQMLASSELISALAEQNTEVIRRAELNRRRVLALAVVTSLLCLVVAKLWLG